MKRLMVLLMVLFAVVSAGCVSPPVDDVYFVMFDSKPGIVDGGVYFRGSQIGEIVSTQISANTIAKLTILIKKEHMDLMKENVVFYISRGKLTYATVANYGAPLPTGSKISGFRSKASLYWFKAKNILQQPSLAASKRANCLFERTF